MSFWFCVWQRASIGSNNIFDDIREQSANSDQSTQSNPHHPGRQTGFTIMEKKTYGCALLTWYMHQSVNML